ncbi:MAG: hypothetical protein ACI4KF_03630 [Huintestinicola sp.]
MMITETPDSNYDTLCNFCRYVDGRAKFLETSSGKNTDIYDFCRKKCKEKCNVDFPEKDDGSMMDKMCFDCSGNDCLNYLLYISAVQAAELREHIKTNSPDEQETSTGVDCIPCEISIDIGNYRMSYGATATAAASLREIIETSDVKFSECKGPVEYQLTGNEDDTLNISIKSFIIDRLLKEWRGRTNDK